MRVSYLPFALRGLQLVLSDLTSNTLPSYRLCGACVRRFSTGHEQQRKAYFKVAKFGELVIRSESVCDFEIQPVSPQLFPDQDHATFETDGTDVSSGIDILCSALDDGNKLVVTKKVIAQSLLSKCTARVPVKYG